jgi:hypothetical protein
MCKSGIEIDISAAHLETVKQILKKTYQKGS